MPPMAWVQVPSTAPPTLIPLLFSLAGMVFIFAKVFMVVCGRLLSFVKSFAKSIDICIQVWYTIIVIKVKTNKTLTTKN